MSEKIEVEPTSEVFDEQQLIDLMENIKWDKNRIIINGNEKIFI